MGARGAGHGPEHVSIALLFSGLASAHIHSVLVLAPSAQIKVKWQVLRESPVLTCDTQLHTYRHT